MKTARTLPERPYMQRIVAADFAMDDSFARQSEITTRIVNDSYFDVPEAGYCLDAPTLLPTGGAMSREQNYLEPRWIKRGW